MVEYTKNNLWERLKKFTVFCYSIVHGLCTKSKFSKNENSEYSKQCSSILLFCNTDSDSTQILINSQDHWGWGKVNDNIQNIFLECEKSFLFIYFKQINAAQLVQEMQSLSYFKFWCIMLQHWTKGQ